MTSLIAGEATAAMKLARSVDFRDMILRGDTNDDANQLCELVAQRSGRKIAPRRKPGTGLSNRRHHHHRLQVIAELESRPSIANAHRRHRNRIEQAFGRLANLPIGLSPLRNSVRRLD